MPDLPVTQILAQVNAGDEAAMSRLLDIVYDDLRALSAKQLRSERADHTLQPTALAHEAWLRLVRQEQTDWQNRAHFFAVAARMIRRVLVDHARAKATGKRDAAAAPEPRTRCYTADGELDLLDLDEALTRLAGHDPEAARVVEMRFFAELTNDEIAHVLGVNERTVRRTWHYAKAWLHRELGGGPAPE